MLKVEEKNLAETQPEFSRAKFFLYFFVALFLATVTALFVLPILRVILEYISGGGDPGPGYSGVLLEDVFRHGISGPIVRLFYPGYLTYFGILFSTYMFPSAVLATVLAWLTFKYRQIFIFSILIFPSLIILLTPLSEYFGLSYGIVLLPLIVFVFFFPITTLVWIANQTRVEDTKKFFRVGLWVRNLWIGVRVFVIAVIVFAMAYNLGIHADTLEKQKQINEFKQEILEEGTPFLSATYLPPNIEKTRDYNFSGKLVEVFNCSAYSGATFTISQSPFDSQSGRDVLYTRLFDARNRGYTDVIRVRPDTVEEVIINGSLGFYLEVLSTRIAETVVWETEYSSITVSSDSRCEHSKEELIKTAQSMRL